MNTGKRVLVVSAVCVSSVVIFCFLALMAIGLLLETGYIPDTKVLKGSELTSKTRQTLVDLEVLKLGEEVLYFYSAGLMSVAEDGNFFTPERVVSYENREGEFSVSQAEYSEIVSITTDSEASYFEDGLILVETTGEDDFYLLVSSEDGRDKLFIQELRKRWRTGQQKQSSE